MIAVLLAPLLTGCVLDRTGQSITEAYRRDMILHATRLNNLENQFDNIEARTSQQEELTRTRGQEEIMAMESLEELRGEISRLRGDVEVLSYDYGVTSESFIALSEDAVFRLVWLEDRALQLEENLGLNPPSPPDMASSTSNPAASATDTAPADTATEAEAVPSDVIPEDADPDALIALAEQHLAAGREKPAEAVLNRFLDRHPDHERVPEALYRRAEAAFNAEDYSGAVLRFQEVIDGHKDNPWAAWAMLRQGECFEAQDQPENARLFYEDVERLWPKSKAAKEARKKL
ncbi:MAG: tetratricopeptide repeat protein [Myxococcota bacterium]|nr:tetratricopeptide repeat protein [Myxococcota bacterium]